MDRPAEILVVLDPDATDHPALDKAARLAAANGSRLRLFCCDHDPRLTARLMLSPEALSAARAGFLRRRREWLETLAAPLRARGLEAEIEAVWDSPLHAGILREVALSGPGLVVKEARWHPPLRRRLFTGPDWHLVHACPVPLLLVKSDPWGDPPRIAAAIDPGHPGDPADVLNHAILRHAAAYAGWLGGALTAVHAFLAVDPALQAALAAGAPIAPPSVDFGTSMRSAAREAVDALLVVHDGQRMDAELIEGAALDVLPSWCEERDIDLLVVGAMSRSRLFEAVLGGTAERLLDRIASDLLVVRARAPG
jgi:universal stress protein E